MSLPPAAPRSTTFSLAFVVASREPSSSRPISHGAWIEIALAGGSLPPVDLRSLSGFDALVCRAAREVPPCETVTYGEVAASIGSPGTARAVEAVAALDC